MPGKKSLKKLEKQQQNKAKEATKARKKREKIIGSVEIPESNSEEVMDALKKMKAITPAGVAGQFNLKVSVAKKLLKELEVNGTLSVAVRSRNLKVYALNED